MQSATLNKLPPRLSRTLIGRFLCHRHPCISAAKFVTNSCSNAQFGEYLKESRQQELIICRCYGNLFMMWSNFGSDFLKNLKSNLSGNWFHSFLHLNIRRIDKLRICLFPENLKRLSCQSRSHFEFWALHRGKLVELIRADLSSRDCWFEPA
jgi:hypothetical protein